MKTLLKPGFCGTLYLGAVATSVVIRRSNCKDGAAIPAKIALGDRIGFCFKVHCGARSTSLGTRVDRPLSAIFDPPFALRESRCLLRVFRSR